MTDTPTPALREAAVALLECLEEAMQTHIYDFDNGDEIEPDCGYLAAINDTRRALGMPLLDTDLEEVSDHD